MLHRCVQEVVGKIFLDNVAFVTATDYELINAVMAVGLEDVPENRLAPRADSKSVPSALVGAASMG